MDFVVVDETDTAMQGTIRSQDICYFEHWLHEGQIYILSNFVVCPSKPSFRVVPNELMLRFSRATIVTHHPENIATISQHKFFFVDFDEVTTRVYKDIQLTGRTCLCSSSATRFYIDLEVPEVIEFRQKIDTLEVTTLMNNRQFTTMSPTDEFSDNKKNISELQQLDPKLQQNIRFSCRATVSDVDVSDGWWYNACTQCKGGLKKFENKFWCDRCCVEDFALPWYKVNITVQDESGYTSFVLFGTLVAELIGITCSTLASNPNYDRMTLPPVLKGG